MSAEQLLGSVADDDVIVVADLEAGIGTLTRLADGAVDLVVVVVEPTPRSIDVARRAVAVASEQGPVVIVANKVADDDDRHRVTTPFPDALIVPGDAVVDEADRRGDSPLDAPESVAVDALQPLVDRIVEAARGSLSANQH